MTEGERGWSTSKILENLLKHVYPNCYSYQLNSFSTYTHMQHEGKEKEDGILIYTSKKVQMLVKQGREKKDQCLLNEPIF